MWTVLNLLRETLFQQGVEIEILRMELIDGVWSESPGDTIDPTGA
jgi:hypothetical protein